jgi:hypothetical protein
VRQRRTGWEAPLPPAVLFVCAKRKQCSDIAVACGMCHY